MKKNEGFKMLSLREIVMDLRKAVIKDECSTFIIWKKEMKCYSDELQLDEIGLEEYYYFLADIYKIDSKAIVINGCNSFYDERCFKCGNHWYSYNKSNIENEIELVEYYYLRQTKIYD